MTIETLPFKFLNDKPNRVDSSESVASKVTLK